MIKNCIRENRPLPAKIANAPEISPGEYFYFVAFNELSTCRYTEGGQIPWIAIKKYSDTHSQDEEQAEFLFDIVRKIDIWFIDYFAKKNTPPKGGKGKKGRK